MKSFDKADDAFIQAAVDDSRRPELIASMARRRTMVFWAAVISSVCALAIMFIEITGKAHISGMSGAVFFYVSAMNWMQVMKCDSDLRLLKMVDKLVAKLKK
jgi:hypothetical protein